MSNKLEKAKRLIELAVAPSASPGEAANAALAAVKLIHAHKLLDAAPPMNTCTMHDAAEEILRRARAQERERVEKEAKAKADAEEARRRAVGDMFKGQPGPVVR